jgi:hypothetical protein
MSKKVPVSICPEISACWYTVKVRLISAADAAYGSRIFQHNFQLFYRGGHSVEMPGFARISWKTFPTRCNISKSLIVAECDKVCRCSHSPKSRGLRLENHVGQLTGPPWSIHCSPKVWFRCCLPMRRKYIWVVVPSRMNHMFSLMKRQMFQGYWQTNNKKVIHCIC